MGSPGVSAKQLVGVGTGQGHDEVEPVQQRGREAPRVPGAVGVGAAAGALEDPFPAGAGVHGRGKEELGREGDGAAGAAHPDHALFERLAQGLEGGHRELPHLVEEEHPMGGQADLAGAQRPAAPADQGHQRGAVVREPGTADG